MCEHLTPVLRQLHWLPVRQRIEFKVAVLVYKALNDLAPQHLIDDCQLVADTGRCLQLRSSDNFKCAYISTNSRFGDRVFAAAGPRLLNSLPVHISQPALTLDSFFRQLKTYFIVRARGISS